MVLGSCACCAGMLPFWVICVVCVWRWLCGLVLCIQTTRLNTKWLCARYGVPKAGGKCTAGQWQAEGPRVLSRAFPRHSTDPKGHIKHFLAWLGHWVGFDHIGGT
jgi:hypothetical protein